MICLFVSKISKILNFNKYENYKDYQDMVIKRELKLKRTTQPYFNHNVSLPDIEYQEEKIQFKKRKYDNFNSAVNKTSNCDYGIFHELITFKQIDKFYDITDKQCLFKKRINNMTLIGRIDGLIDNKLLEIKSRRNKFIGLYKQDIIQIQLYLYITDLTECIVIEHFKNNLKRYRIKRDDNYINVILALLNQFIEHTRLNFCLKSLFIKTLV